MEKARWQRITELVSKALELPVAEREAFVTEQSAGDGDLQAEVESLLAQDEVTSGPLDRAALEFGGALQDLAGLGAGERVGPYVIQRELGSGGMGQVYLALREGTGYRQEVALKVIRPGLCTQEVLQRFHAERGILARLDHPNIARILDGGMTEGGAPYFVMEYIDGQPLTEFCEERRLGLTERLRLFRDVCAAGHHAHQNLIVHRDLKPSNILVTPEGLPKLLDFGIAKVLDPEGQDLPVAHTRTDARIMTPEYASPEQVRGAPVTTASDVYSLGVLLYELLTGERPHSGSGRDLEQAICERVPQKPSAIRSSGTGGEVLGLRDRRRLRGDLDNIVMLALRKEPERRYASLQAFAADIDRHFAGRPVTARRDTLFYTTGKFVRRNPVAVTLALGLAVALVVFAAVTRTQASRIAAQSKTVMAERDAAEFVTRWMEDLFTYADPRAVQGAEVSARELLELGRARLSRLDERPEVKVRLMVSMARAYNGMDLLSPAEELLVEAVALAEGLEDPRQLATTRSELAHVISRLGRLDESEAMHADALASWREAVEPEGAFVALQLQRLGWIAEHRGDPQEGERLYRESADMLAALPGEEVRYAETLTHLGHLLMNRDGPEVAAPLLEEAHEILVRAAPPDDPNVGLSFQNLGKLETSRGNYQGAEAYLREALELRLRVYGEGSVSEAMSRNELAVAQRRQGKYDDAEENYRAALEILSSTLGEEHFWVAQAMFNLGSVQRYRGELGEAKALLGDALDIGRAVRPANHPDLAHMSRTFVEVLLEREDYEEAEPVAREAWRICLLALEPSNSLRVDCLLHLANTLYGLEREFDAGLLLEEQLDLLVEAQGDEGEAAVRVRTRLEEL